MGVQSLKKLSTISSVQAITLEQAKAHCFIAEEDTSQDTALTAQIQAAQSVIEGFAQVAYCFDLAQYQAIITQEKARILLPKTPTVSVESVEEFNGSDWSEVSSQSYSLERGDKFDFLNFANYTPTIPPRRLRITFTAGHETADTIGLDVKQAVAMLVAYLYEYRAMQNAQQLYDNAVFGAIISRFKRYSI